MSPAPPVFRHCRPSSHGSFIPLLSSISSAIFLLHLPHSIFARAFVLGNQILPKSYFSSLLLQISQPLPRWLPAAHQTKSPDSAVPCPPHLTFSSFPWCLERISVLSDSLAPAFGSGSSFRPPSESVSCPFNWVTPSYPVRDAEGIVFLP